MATRRVLRGLLAVLAALALVAVALTLLARRALEPDSLRAMAESRLTAALGVRVVIGKIDVSVFPSPRIDASEIRVGDAGAGRPGLGLRSLRIVPTLSSIFSRPLVVQRVEVEGLTLDATRDREGRWILPIPSASTPAADTSANEPPPDPAARVDVGRAVLRSGRITVTDDRPPGAGVPQGASLENISASLRLHGGVAELDDLDAALGGSRLSGRGSASRAGVRLALAWRALKAEDVPLVFGLLGVGAPAGLVMEGERPLELDLLVDAQGRLTAAGRLAATQLRLGTLGVTALASPVRFEQNRLALDPLTCAAYGGQQRGSLTADVGRTPAAWTLHSAIEGVDVNQFLSANTSARDVLDGKGHARADLQGTAARPIERTVRGTIAASVSNGVLLNFPLLASIDSALALTGGSRDRQLKFEALSATLHVADAQATTDDLLVRSGDLTLHAAGRVGFDQALDLAGTVTFTREKSDELVRQVKDLGGLRNSQGELEVPLTLRGTASNPSISIQVGKVLGRATQKEVKRQLGRGLRKLIKIR